MINKKSMKFQKMKSKKNLKRLRKFHLNQIHLKNKFPRRKK